MMKKFMLMGVLGLGLTACLSTTPQSSQVSSQNPQYIPATPEQNAKIVEAINKNKGAILEQLNKAAKEQIEGKTFEVPMPAQTNQ
ncbi:MULTISPECIES: hypothetical protein [Rodentibacter]|uniref:hypothetical protein n=1 Tax=Rodentibacter TaxID=1960084 RepID=UPI001CFD2E27|nr:hypothetical protein [Rodentibacter sp. JRC1]GJI55573.1 hypothetical protein HEMROJRC1_06850 [Rodentibacter sp. JRC1]